MKTADQILAVITAASEDASPALQSLAEVNERKQTAARLEREMSEEGADEATAKAFVKASEEARLYEMMRAPREAAAKAAEQSVRSAGCAALRMIADHFLNLSNEARDLGLLIMQKLTCPQAAAIRADSAPAGYQRDHAQASMAGFIIGNFAAWQKHVEANQCAKGILSDAAVPNAQNMLRTFDADTAAIRADISKLQQILSVLDGGESERQGTVSTPAAQPSKAA